jgi:hypothetical protein
MLELWSPRMGGGALHPRTVEYKTIPIPDIGGVARSLQGIEFGNRPTLPYNEEIKQKDRFALDMAILKGIGFGEKEAEKILPELYNCYLELVADRLTKAVKYTAQKASQVENIVEMTIETSEDGEDNDKDN